jgi:hypothetical protein
MAVPKSLPEALGVIRHCTSKCRRWDARNILGAPNRDHPLRVRGHDASRHAYLPNALAFTP